MVEGSNEKPSGLNVEAVTLSTTEVSKHDDTDHALSDDFAEVGEEVAIGWRSWLVMALTAWASVLCQHAS